MSAIASLVAYNAYSANGELIISEIHYHPSGDNNDLSEWIEFKNVGDSPLSSADCRIEGIGTVALPAVVLAPDEFIVLAANVAQFTNKYEFAPTGTYTGSLSNSGETISISDLAQIPVFSVRYWDGAAPNNNTEMGRDAWPVSPDGDGYTLTLRELTKRGCLE